MLTFHSEQYIGVLFTDPQITLFNNFFIKNGSHSTIYTFKNYFAIMFSVSVFSFSKNKLNPNTAKLCMPLILLMYAYMHGLCQTILFPMVLIPSPTIEFWCFPNLTLTRLDLPFAFN